MYIPAYQHTSKGLDNHSEQATAAGVRHLSSREAVGGLAEPLSSKPCSRMPLTAKHVVVCLDVHSRRSSPRRYPCQAAKQASSIAAPFALVGWICRVPLMRDASHIAIRSAPPVPWVSGFRGGQDVKPPGGSQARSPVEGSQVLSLEDEEADCRNAWSSSKTVTCRPSFPRKRNAEDRGRLI
jgi:hypothetical protein